MLKWNYQFLPKNLEKRTNNQTKRSNEGKEERKFEWVNNSLLSTQLKQLPNFTINDRTVSNATIKSSLESECIQIQTNILLQKSCRFVQHSAREVWKKVQSSIPLPCFLQFQGGQLKSTRQRMDPASWSHTSKITLAIYRHTSNQGKQEIYFFKNKGWYCQHSYLKSQGKGRRWILVSPHTAQVQISVWNFYLDWNTLKFSPFSEANESSNNLDLFWKMY